MRPPQLELQPGRLPSRVLPAAPASPDPADPTPAEPSTLLALRLANTGGVTLALHLALEPRSTNLLLPGLWLDPGSNFTAAFAGNSPGACCRIGSGEGTPTSQAGAGAPACSGDAAWGACSGSERAGALAESGMVAAEGPGSGSGSGYRDTLDEGVELRAGAPPLRLAAALAPPAAVRASLIRRAECDGHFLVLSARPQAPRHRGMQALLAG